MSPHQNVDYAFGPALFNGVTLGYKSVIPAVLKLRTVWMLRDVSA